MAQRFARPLHDLLELDVDEVALVVLNYLRREVANGRQPHLGNALNDVRIEAHESRLIDSDAKRAITLVAASWQWLRNHLLVVPAEGFWETLTPAAEETTVPGYLLETRAQDLLGGLQLDPRLAQQALPSFRRGSYAVAVLAAFRLVESRVRDEARMARRDIGQDLMLRAFKPGGPLADPQLLDSENLGRAHLFAGAIGAIKNEHSHRTVDIDDPQDAAELVLFANMLLRIVGRAAPSESPGVPSPA